MVKIRGKIRTAKLSIEFLKTCQAQHVIPTFMSHRIKAAKVRQTSTMAGWSNFCTLVGHFSKLFEFAGLSRLKIPIFVPKSECSLKKKKKKKGLHLESVSKIPILAQNHSVLQKKLRLLLLIDKTCAKLICGMRPASP